MKSIFTLQNRNLLKQRLSKWDEEKHPRSKDGKFGSGEGEGKSEFGPNRKAAKGEFDRDDKCTSIKQAKEMLASRGIKYDDVKMHNGGKTASFYDGKENVATWDSAGSEKILMTNSDKNKSGSADDDMSPREKKLWDEHEKEGAKAYGKDRWNNANIGWGTDEDSISSKIYGHKGKEPMVLTTYIDKHGKVGHTHEPYRSM